MGFVSILLVGAALVDVAAYGVDGGHDAASSGPLADAPAPVAAVAGLSRLHVPPGDQCQDAGRVRSLLAQLLVGQVTQQPERVTDQGVDEVGAACRSFRAMRGLPGSV
ncbi:hypothetical protein ACGFX8_36995 [Streptomyces sp. NPDC048362]|uniref:hypothetical protein n=1 Tax=Streptomyces sp. NPDC048362 TaxID=3365539 RepID=UPI003724B28B